MIRIIAGSTQTACCALCWIDGVRSEPTKGWDGIPMCREHLCEIVEKNSPSVPLKKGYALPHTTQQ
jgi:hypothetical protein